MLIKAIKLALISLTLGACGSGNVKVPHPTDFAQIDSRLTPYLNDFLQRCESFDAVGHLCRTNLRRLTHIKVEEQPSGVLGRCIVWSGTLQRQISISPAAFKNELFLEQVMFHEMGHCLLDADHVNPAYGIHTMNPAINRLQDIEENRESMLVTLFTFIEPLVRQFNFHVDNNIPTIPCDYSRKP